MSRNNPETQLDSNWVVILRTTPTREQIPTADYLSFYPTGVGAEIKVKRYHGSALEGNYR